MTSDMEGQERDVVALITMRIHALNDVLNALWGADDCSAVAMAIGAKRLDAIFEAQNSLFAEITRLRSQVVSPVVEGWQDISMAPKDGSWFLGCYWMPPRTAPGTSPPPPVTHGLQSAGVTALPDEASKLREALVIADTRLREHGDMTNHPVRVAIGTVLGLPGGTDEVPSLWRPGDRIERNGQLLEYIETEIEGEKWRVVADGGDRG